MTPTAANSRSPSSSASRGARRGADGAAGRSGAARSSPVAAGAGRRAVAVVSAMSSPPVVTARYQVVTYHGSKPGCGCRSNVTRPTGWVELPGPAAAAGDGRIKWRSPAHLVGGRGSRRARRLLLDRDGRVGGLEGLLGLLGSVLGSAFQHGLR